MFLYTLNDQQKLAHLFLAKKMIMADGILADEEKTLFEAMLREMQITDQTTPEYSDEQLADIFNTESIRKKILIELFGLAYADNEYVQEEKDLINHLAKIFDVNQIELSKIENTLKRYFRVTVELIDLVN